MEQSHQLGRMGVRSKHVSAHCLEPGSAREEEASVEVHAEERPADSAGAAVRASPSNLMVAALVAICSVAVVICYADRSNIADAIIPMEQEFGWGRSSVGVVLSSFFIGYASTQMLGGWMADRYGGKGVLTAVRRYLGDSIKPPSVCLSNAPTGARGPYARARCAHVFEPVCEMATY